MFGQSNPRKYKLRERRANNAQSSEVLDDNPPSLPENSSNAEPSATNPPNNPTGNSTSPSKNQEEVHELRTRDNMRRHQLTIKRRLFYGPLPQSQTTSKPTAGLDPNLNYQAYPLFTCENCPIPQNNSSYDLHELCYDSHPCIWSFPPKAREVFVNRRHWLKLGQPLEATRLPKGGFPRTLDEDGETVTSWVRDMKEGVDLDPKKAHNEIVTRMYEAVIKGNECAEHRGAEAGDLGLEAYCERHRRAREGMLEYMDWKMEWGVK